MFGKTAFIIGYIYIFAQVKPLKFNINQTTL
jgi:hypothetical protein